MNAKNVIVGSVLIIAALAVGILIGIRMDSSVAADQNFETSEQNDASSSEGAILYWKAPMNPTEIYDAPGKSRMGMDLVPVYEGEGKNAPAGQVTISPTVSQNMGVRYAKAERMDLFRSIRTVGEVMVDEERVFQVNSRISGWVEKLYVGFNGAPVEEGQPLLEIYSPELVSTQQEYLLARGHLAQVKSDGDENAIANARRLLDAALTRLANWEIPDDVIEAIQQSGEVQRTVLLRSPVTGVVLAKDVIEGAHIEKGTDLYNIADLRSVWVHASFYDNELPWISEGQKADVELSYLPGTTYQGEVSYVYPFLRERARDVHVRIIVENESLEIKPGMYANVELAGRRLEDIVVVPTQAIIRSGERSLVFVADGEGRFDPREVLLGAEGGDGNELVHVISGLEEGERIVVSAQFLIDSESRLQEAIQKMRSVSESEEMPGMDMDSDDGNMSDMDMESMESESSKQELSREGH